MKMNLLQLRSFVVLAESLSFTAAATRLHVTQPTLSGTIKQFEAILGVRLFDRDTRSVRLTAVGAEVLVLSQRVLEELKRSEAELDDLIGARRGSVRLAAPPSLFPNYLSRALARFREDHPGLILDLQDLNSDAAFERLRLGHADMAMMTQIHEEPGYDYIPVCEQYLVLLLPAAHPFAKRKNIDWARVTTAPVIALNSRSTMGTYGEQLLFEAGVRYAPTFRVEQMVAAAGLVRAGMGVAVMSNFSAELLAHEGLVARPLVRPRIARPLCLVTRQAHSLSPAAQRLHDRLAQTSLWQSGAKGGLKLS